MKVLFCTNLPSPYRVDFFNELGKFCDLTVCFERRTALDRDAKWISSQAMSYKEVYLDLQPVGTDRSRGSALRKYIAVHPCDILILTNYSSLACMEAIAYCKIKEIPYWVESDGGFNKSESLPKRLLKKFLLGHAVGHLTTSDEHIAYLKGLGIAPERIYKYPFTSVSEHDLKKASEMIENGKAYYREKLAMKEKRIVLSVGQFIHRKGFDLLISAAKILPETGVYIVGGKPTDEYIELANGSKNIHFVDFMSKEALSEYYCAADLMAFLTREDIWGLVVNEAMAHGLPVLTTDRCIAGLEMIRNGVNGYIVPAGEYKEAAACIHRFFDSSAKMEAMSKECLITAREYTIETMVSKHMEYFNSL